jgi:hypothetical protein
MFTEPYAKTRFRAAMQADEDMRCDQPWLWLFANNTVGRNLGDGIVTSGGSRVSDNVVGGNFGWGLNIPGATDKDNSITGTHLIGAVNTNAIHLGGNWRRARRRGSPFSFSGAGMDRTGG